MTGPGAGWVLATDKESLIRMKRRLLLALVAACPAAVPERTAQSPEPTGPQPELPKEKLIIVTHDGVSHRSRSRWR